MIEVDGKQLPEPERARLWRYHKPNGRDGDGARPRGPPTIFDSLPRGMPRVVTVGRLDFNVGGAAAAHQRWRPVAPARAAGQRLDARYRARVHGVVDEGGLAGLQGRHHHRGRALRAIEAAVDGQQRSNAWLTMSLPEGKNREVRRVLAHLGLPVMRLIRVAFGPFSLGELPSARSRK